MLRIFTLPKCKNYREKSWKKNWPKLAPRTTSNVNHKISPITIVLSLDVRSLTKTSKKLIRLSSISLSHNRNLAQFWMWLVDRLANKSTHSTAKSKLLKFHTNCAKTSQWYTSISNHLPSPKMPPSTILLRIRLTVIVFRVINRKFKKSRRKSSYFYKKEIKIYLKMPRRCLSWLNSIKF